MHARSIYKHFKNNVITIVLKCIKYIFNIFTQSCFCSYNISFSMTNCHDNNNWQSFSITIYYNI